MVVKTKLASLGFYFSRELHEQRPEHKGASRMQEDAGNIFSLINVLTLRLQEYFDRKEHGADWKPHSLERLNDNFSKFFSAIEKNSRGKYQIMFSPGGRGESDYLVNLSFGTNGDKELLMPPVLEDVFRDLIANARNYTPPGGEITASLTHEKDELRLTVQDNGNGIPLPDLQKVVEFGYRAENVREQKTKGGGFGLTKAYTVTRDLDGRMWIDSAKDQSTKVTIRIPIPTDSGGN